MEAYVLRPGWPVMSYGSGVVVTLTDEEVRIVWEGNWRAVAWEFAEKVREAAKGCIFPYPAQERHIREVD